MPTYTISETQMKSILMTMARRKEELAKEWWKQDNNDELDSIEWDAINLCDNRTLKEFWIEHSKEGDKWYEKQRKAEGVIIHSKDKTQFKNETYETYQDLFVHQLTAEDDYHEHMLMEDPNNVHIEEPYTMREDDDEFEEGIAIQKKRYEGDIKGYASQDINSFEELLQRHAPKSLYERYMEEKYTPSPKKYSFKKKTVCKKEKTYSTLDGAKKIMKFPTLYTFLGDCGCNHCVRDETTIDMFEKKKKAHMKQREPKRGKRCYRDQCDYETCKWCDWEHNEKWLDEEIADEWGTIKSRIDGFVFCHTTNNWIKK